MTPDSPDEVNLQKSCQEGLLLDIKDNYGGLGNHYLQTLSQNINKINQIDTITGVTETNGSVRSRALHIAGELKRLNINENDIVLICSRCHADQTVTVLASLLIGCIIAPVTTDFNHKECFEILKKLNPKVCFCDIRALKQIDQVIQEIGLNTKMILYGEPKQAIISFQKLLLNKPSLEIKHVIIDNPRKKVSFILPTQGTAGPPKLVCLSHHFIYTQTLLLLNSIPVPEKIISFYPLCWVLQVVLMCVSFEEPIARILSGAFAERNACKLIHDLQIDYAFISTALAIKLVEHVAVRDFNLSCLKYMVIGATFGNSSELKQLVSKLPRVKFIPIYCTTETGIVATCPDGDYDEYVDRLGTAGKVVFNTKFKIVDIDKRNMLGSEMYGELLISGNTLMLGYLKNSNQTKASMEDEYFKTGDMAKFDGSGWLYLEEKINNLLKTSNGRRSPRELETVVTLHPYVKEAAVVGNEKEILACVVLKPQMKVDEDKLFMFISQRLTKDKWPTRIVFTDAFPTTFLGKIKKETLRDNCLRVQIQKSDSFDLIAVNRA